MPSDAVARAGGRLAVLAVALFGFGAPLLAQSNLPLPKYEESTPVEAEVTLPPYPEASVLMRFPTSWTTHEVFVDTRSLTSNADGLVRFTLVVRSSSGADNVSHEGIRCYSGERRVYAWGRRGESGGSWVNARNANWQPITDRGINRHYFEFWRDVFCDGRVAEPRNVMLDNIRRGGRTRAQGNPSE